MLEKDGETHCRPIFILTDDFVKIHRVRRQRIHHVPQLTPLEEINYSLLAIKFSKVLTKDMVFAGLRDIFRKMGEFITRGYEMEIAFTFGVLRAKESKVKFIFNQSRLLQILPENIEPGVYAHTDKPLKYIENTSAEVNEFSSASARGDVPQSSARPQTSQSMSSNASSSLSLPQINKRPPMVPSLSLNRPGTSDSSNNLMNRQDSSSPSMTMQYPTTFDATTTSNNHFDDELEEEEEQYNETSSSNAAGGIAMASQGDIAPNIQELMAMIEYHRKNKQKVKDQAKNRVMSQAFQRCLQELEHNAMLDDRQRFEEMKKTELWKSATMKEREQMRSSVFSLRKALDEQLEEHRMRDEAAKMEKKNTIMRFILPDTAGMAPSPLGTFVDENGNIVNGRQRIAKDLSDQIKKNEQMRVTVKRETQKQERDMMNRLALETELHNVVERSKYLEKQKALVEAWERDGHVRNIRKLQPLGQELVQDYIHKHLQDPALTLTTLPPSLDQSLTRSIGYDPRKGRL